MTVTKQQQLEFAAMHIDKWKSGYDFAVIEKTNDGQLCVRWPSICSGGVSKKEWQQERDKMQKQQDNSWHERGELPPIGCECEVFDGDDWLQSFIVGRSRSGDVVVQTRTGYFEASHAKFRPLRTEMEMAIDEMMSLVIDGLMSHEMAKELVIKLHDSGYRKVKP